MTNILLILLLVLILGLAARYIYKSKKSGKKCAGCPYADTCGKTDCHGS